jgi:DNA-binding transcriptional MocR family regulator
MSIRAVAWALDQVCPSPLAKLVLIKLAHHASEENECWPSQRRIAEACGASRETINRTLKALEAAGLIRLRQRTAEHGGKMSNLYSLPCDQTSQPYVTEDHIHVTEDHKGCDASVTRDVITASHKEPSIERSEEKNPPTPPRGNGAALKAEFAEWWLAYPHKVGKGAAEQKFAIARRSASLAELIEGVRRYITAKPLEHNWCNPATWLHQRRWEDQPADLLAQANGAEVSPEEKEASRLRARQHMLQGG